jgi:nucleotide-binding universal stress UspA family protein
LVINKNLIAMKKILVPYDFSKTAVNAYRFALDIAAQSKGIIHLVNVIELPVLHDTVLMPVLNFEETLLKELKEKAEGNFTTLLAKYKPEGTKIVRSVQFGPVLGTLRDYIRQESIDIVIMGSHGASGLREFFIGSNAEKMVRFSPVPVTVIKEYRKTQIKNIVFPNTLDTEEQEDLVMKVKALQHFFKAHVHIVWINTPLNFSPDTETLARLHTFARRFMLKDYTVHVFNHWEEENGILDFTRVVKGDLIAMGTRGRKGIAHLINGSLAEDVVNHSNGLVWTYTGQLEAVTLKNGLAF